MSVPQSLPNSGNESGSIEDTSIRHSRARRNWLGAISIGFSLATTALLLKPAQPTIGSTHFGDFRGLFAFDQLSYAAIATNASTGELLRVEPFTQTGVSYFPSFWYEFLGLASSYLEIGIPAVWTVFGSAMVALMVLAIGLIAISVSGRAWAAALVGPALWIGPLALAFFPTWYLPPHTSSKLWGPYGLLFSLNAEAVGISLAASSIGIAVWALLDNKRKHKQIWIFSLSALLLGFLANIEFSVFLIATTLVLAWLAIWGLGLLNRRARLLAMAMSLGVFGAGLVAAQTLKDVYGSFFFMVLLIVAALPGIAALANRHKWMATIIGTLYLLGALPQLIQIGNGLLSRDPFFQFYQVNFEFVTVQLQLFLAATAPIGAWIAALSVLLRHTSAPAPLRALVWASAITIPLLTFNGVWGFAQDTYRMWNGSVALTSILLVLPTALVTAKLRYSQVRATKVPHMAAIGAALIALSWWNLGGFRNAVDAAGSVKFGSPRLDALRQITPDLDGLVISDPCIDLQELKIVSSGPVAFYNPSLAWPANREAIDISLTERDLGEIDINSLREAQIDFVVTDSSCDTNYKPNQKPGYLLIRMLEYRAGDEFGTLEVWRVT